MAVDCADGKLRKLDTPLFVSTPRNSYTHRSSQNTSLKQEILNTSRDPSSSSGASVISPNLITPFELDDVFLVSPNYVDPFEKNKRISQPEDENNAVNPQNAASLKNSKNTSSKNSENTNFKNSEETNLINSENTNLRNSEETNLINSEKSSLKNSTVEK